MTKYLTTVEELKQNIGKKINFKDLCSNTITGILKISFKNNEEVILIFSDMYNNNYYTIHKKAEKQEIIDLEIELIEEDNQEQDNKKTVNIKKLSDELDEMIKNNKPMGLADNINHPSHYQGKIECIDYLQDKLTAEEFRGFLKGNVLKYLSRATKKENELEDYKKAQWYMNKLIKQMEK